MGASTKCAGISICCISVAVSTSQCFTRGPTSSPILFHDLVLSIFYQLQINHVSLCSFYAIQCCAIRRAIAYPASPCATAVLYKMGTLKKVVTRRRTIPVMTIADFFQRYFLQLSEMVRVIVAGARRNVCIKYKNKKTKDNSIKDDVVSLAG